MRPALFGLLLLLLSLGAKGQGTTADFGQNRVQYKTFEWSYFETEHFLTYFYLGGQDIGKYATIYSETVLDEIGKLLEYRVNTQIEILVYNDLSDLNQTNIGIGMDVNNTGGMTKIIGNKIFVYFDGDHAHLEEQLRRGIAQVFINHLLFGTSFQEVLQNAVLLNLPQWYTDGLASYIGEDWNVEMEDRLRDGILSGKYKKINRLKGDEARFVGHAIWHYVEMKYGKSSVPNLIYLTRINRSLESGFLFVLGGSVDDILTEWYNDMYSYYSGLETTNDVPSDANMIPKRNWVKRAHYQPKMTDDGKYVAFVTNIMDVHRVHVVDVATGKRKRILKYGHKTTTLVTDNSYPLLAWSPDKKTLAIIYNRRDKVFFTLYDAETGKKEKREMAKFKFVHDFSFTDNPNLIVLSAVQNGQSDIFTYEVASTKLQQITNDYYDDLYPAYINVQGRTGIIFSSNRVSDTMTNERFDTTLLRRDLDLFFYNMKTGGNMLSRLTFTDHTREVMPAQFNDTLFAFLSDKNGIQNRFAGYFKTIEVGKDTVVFFTDSTVTNPAWNLYDKLEEPDKGGIDSFHINPIYKDIGVTFPATNYAGNIIEQDISAQGQIALEMFRVNGTYQFYINPLPKDLSRDFAPRLTNTPYKDYYLSREKKKAENKGREKPTPPGMHVEETEEPTQTTQPKDSTENETAYFQNDWNTSPNLVVTHTEPVYTGGPGVNIGGPQTTGTQGTQPLVGTSPGTMITRMLPYRVKFSTDYITTQIDNSLIMTRYEVFRPGVPVFNNPALSGMFNLGISDLFEDHKITGGIRFPFNFQGSEYFIAYENLKKRLDKKFMYYRKVDKQSFSPNETLPFVGTSAPASYPANLNVEAKIKTNYVEMRLLFPIDVTKSFRWYMAYRSENYVYLAQEEFTLNLPNYNQNWLFGRMEFVHDQTIKVAENILNGFRYKVYGEIHKQFTMEKRNLFNNLDVKLPSFDNRYFVVFGADFRYYQKIHRELTWANRFSMGTSFGTRKLIYYLGGVDSWIAPQFNNSIPVNEDNDYAFQTVVTNMRGFKQNIRNGNSYAVLNSEIRWPVFKYFIQRPIKSEFVKNFQIVGFTDIGTAWEGKNPYDESNPLFIDYIERDPVSIKVEYFRNPIVVGYGFGFRSTLLGYFMRFDIAWGKDSGDTNGPVFYFSLCKDF